MNAKIAALLEAWKGLPRKQQNTALFGITIVLVALYFILFWRESYGKRKDIEYQLAKQILRTRKGAASESAPTPKIAVGESPARLERDLKTVNERLAAATAENERWKRRFIDLDGPDMLKDLQTLKVGITRLAESGDMEVQHLEHVLANESDRNKPATVVMLKAAAARNAYRRPLLRFKARASYRGLMQFLNGLDGLPYVAAPVRSSIEVRNGDPSERQSWLSVEFDLAV